MSAQEISSVQSSDNNQGGTEAVGALQKAGVSGSDLEKAKSVKMSSVDELREKEPKLYDLISKALARNICEQLKKHADRMKELMRENTKNS